MTLSTPGLQMWQLGLFGRFRGRTQYPQPGAPGADRRATLALFKPMHRHGAHGPLDADQVIRLLGEDEAR